MSEAYKRAYMLRKINDFEQMGFEVKNLQKISKDAPIEDIILEYMRLKKLHEEQLKKQKPLEELIVKTDRFKIFFDIQKGILAHPIWRVYDANMKLVELYMAPKSFSDSIKFPDGCDRKKYLLEKCDISYDSFYEFDNEDDVVSFLLNIKN